MDYSEEVKWQKAESLYRKFNAFPHLYGPTLVELDPSSPLLTVNHYTIPDELERQLVFYKEKYWGKAGKFYGSFSSVYFLICVTYSQKIADKVFVQTFLRSHQSQIDEALTIHTTLVDDEFIKKFNTLVKIQGATTISNYLRVFYKAIVTSISSSPNYGDILPMWLLRYTYIV